MTRSIPSLIQSPIGARVAPFLLFIVLTFAQGAFGPGGQYWLYAAKTILAVCLLWAVRRQLKELEWRLSWEAVVVGVLVFWLWVRLDDLFIQVGISYPKMKLPAAEWNPHVHFGQGAALAWFFIGVRILGSSLVVPPLQEIFFRSFLYRYVARVDFQSVPLGTFLWMPFLLTSVVFGLEHREWLAGILGGVLYQGLVCRKKRLGDAVTAHAITNLLLGVWVVWKGQWIYW